MGICYLSRRIPYEPGFEEQQGVYPIGENGMPEGDIYIPEGCTILSKYICSENPQVTGIILPGSITGFEDDCFLNCPNITKVCCVNGIQTISTQCFSNCELLEEVTLPKSLKTIQARAFKNCPSLKNIIFTSKENDNPIYEAHDEAFANCPSLTNEDINNIAEYMRPVGQKIFANNPQLTEVEVYMLGDYMFDMTDTDKESHLKKVTVKHTNSFGKISAQFPFNDCYSLETVVLPDDNTVIAIDEKVFLTTDTSSEKSHLANVNIPSSCESIGYKAFYNSPNLRKLFIPKGMTYIGKQAFERSNLSELEVESGINCKLDNFAFKNSKINNESVNTFCLPQLLFDKDNNNNLIVTEQQFAKCHNLTDITTSQSTIAMFEGCKLLAKATINHGTNNTLYAKMFKDCISLVDVIINDNTITTFGESLFDGCSSLKNVTWGTDKDIKQNYGKRMFAASGLEEIKLQDNALNISEEMFKDCKNLKYIYVSNTVKEYSANCFSYCGNLKGSILDNGNKDEKLIIPSSVKKIGDNAFEMCEQLEEAIISSGVTKLDLNIFANCANLKKVTLPATIKNWGTLNTSSSGTGTAYYSNIDKERKDVYYNGKRVNKNLYIFLDCPNLIDVVLGNGWDQTLDLHSLDLTFNSIVQMLNNIADVSSYKEKPSLILGENNLAKIPTDPDDIEKDEEGIEIPGSREAYEAFYQAKEIKKWNIKLQE